MAMLAVKASWGKLWWGVLAGLALLFLIALKTVPGAPPEPLYFVPGNPGKVAFTFEALWGTEGLEEILAVLKREGVHCTFFVTGPWVTRHPESAKAIIGDAHELGNHSCSHRSLLYADEEEITREIQGIQQDYRSSPGVPGPRFPASLWSVQRPDSGQGAPGRAEDCPLVPGQPGLDQRLGGGDPSAFQGAAPGRRHRPLSGWRPGASRHFAGVDQVCPGAGLRTGQGIPASGPELKGGTG